MVCVTNNDEYIRQSSCRILWYLTGRKTNVFVNKYVCFPYLIKVHWCPVWKMNIFASSVNFFFCNSSQQKVSGTSLDNLTNHWVRSFSIKYSFFKINSSFSSKNQKSKHLLNCGWVIQKWVNFTCIFVSFVYIDLAWSVMVVYSKILSLLRISLAK